GADDASALWPPVRLGRCWLRRVSPRLILFDVLPQLSRAALRALDFARRRIPIAQEGPYDRCNQQDRAEDRCQGPEPASHERTFLIRRSTNQRASEASFPRFLARAA